MLKKNLIIFAIIFFTFFLDLITKNYAVNNLLLNHSVIINAFLNFTLAFNYGAAFSFLSDAGGWQRWFFVIFSIAVISFIAYILIKDKDSEYIAYSFIFGGALGNLYDRFFKILKIDILSYLAEPFFSLTL